MNTSQASNSSRWLINGLTTSENNFFIKLSDGGLSQQACQYQFGSGGPTRPAREYLELRRLKRDKAKVSEILSILKLVYCSPNINSIDIRALISGLLLGLEFRAI